MIPENRRRTRFTHREERFLSQSVPSRPSPLLLLVRLSSEGPEPPLPRLSPGPRLGEGRFSHSEHECDESKTRVNLSKHHDLNSLFGDLGSIMESIFPLASRKFNAKPTGMSADRMVSFRDQGNGSEGTNGWEDE